MRQTVLNIHIPSAVLVIAGLLGEMSFAAAQSAPAVCQAPRAGEYVLLVVSATTDSQEQLRRALPNNISSTVCKYLNDTVTRIGGFTQIEEANSWSRYINDIVGLSTFVTTRPSGTSPGTPTYNPQPLGGGYAVLVDYFNRPETATQVRQLLQSDVGLVSYGQRSYLLAVYTTNQRDANSTLQRLSDRGFFAMLVDSRKVTLLRPRVANF